MKPSECGFATPPPEDSEEREQMDRLADFLDLAGKPGDREGARRIKARVHTDPAMREFVFGHRDLHGPAF